MVIRLILIGVLLGIGIYLGFILMRGLMILLSKTKP